MNGDHRGSRWLDSLFASFWLLTVWFGVVLLWLLIPLFLLAMVAMFLDAVGSRPLQATGNLVAGWSIGLFLLWATFAMLKSARVERARKTKSRPDQESPPSH